MRWHLTWALKDEWVEWGWSRFQLAFLYVSIRINSEAEVPILWPPVVKSWLIGKDPDPGKGWRQEEKGVTEDGMVGWHYWLNGYEFEQALGDSEGQGGLVCCSPWGSQRVWHDWVTQQQQLINRRLGDQAWKRRELRRVWTPGIQEAGSWETGPQQEQMGADVAGGAMAVSAAVEISLQWLCNPCDTCSRFGVLGVSGWLTLGHLFLPALQTDEDVGN